MIDLNTTNEWQHRCPATGLVLPWYTKSFLDELVTWDLKDKTVFEYGCGASTLWWVAKCKELYGVESNEEYFDALEVKTSKIACLAHETDRFCYIDYLRSWRMDFDIIIVDGDPVEWRDDCVKSAIANLKPGGRLIIDNWDQKSVWVPSDETRKLLADWPVKIYPQEGHADWKTAVFTKP